MNVELKMILVSGRDIVLTIPQEQACSMMVRWKEWVESGGLLNPLSCKYVLSGDNFSVFIPDIRAMVVNPPTLDIHARVLQIQERMLKLHERELRSKEEGESWRGEEED